MDGRFIHHSNLTNYGLGISKTLKCDTKKKSHNLGNTTAQVFAHHFRCLGNSLLSAAMQAVNHVQRQSLKSVHTSAYENMHDQ